MGRYAVTKNADIQSGDIALLRKQIRIGDTVKYPVSEYGCDYKGEWRRSTNLIKAVVAKYPHLVEGVPKGQERGLPRKTASYIEIAMLERGCL